MGSAGGLNTARCLLSIIEPMRFVLTYFLMPAFTASWAVSAVVPETAPTPAVEPSAAEQGKDVVHALNNAFAKVFDAVAPSVVIIEISKKNDGTEGSPFDDLFFQGPSDEDS